MNIHNVDFNKQENTYLPVVSTADFIGNRRDLLLKSEAQYVGSVNCESCHQEISDKQEASMHTRMIPDDPG